MLKFSVKLNRIASVSVLLALALLTSCKGIEFANQKTAMAEEFSKGEAMVYVAEEKNKYETKFGSGIWALKSGDGKLFFKDYIVDNAKKLVEKIMMLKLVANDLNIVISSTDNEKIDKISNEYFDSLSGDDKDYMTCDYSDVRKAFLDYHIARLTIDNLSKGAESELSISEAKVIKVQYIVFDDIEKAKETKEKLKAKGASFAYFAKTRGTNTEIDLIMKRGDEMAARFPEVFYLSAGEVSEILQNTNKYYLFKCIDDYMEKETEERRVEMLKAMKNEEYNNKVKKYEEMYNFKSNSAYWKQIDLSRGPYCHINKFEDLYYEAFPKTIG